MMCFSSPIFTAALPEAFSSPMLRTITEFSVSVPLVQVIKRKQMISKGEQKTDLVFILRLLSLGKMILHREEWTGMIKVRFM